MINLPSVVRIYLHVQPVNLHFGFDRLANLVREEMGHDPLSGHLFVFRNRRGDRVKLLLWDDDGFLVLYKKLESHYPHLFVFTESRRFANNLGRWLVGAGKVV